MWLLPLASPTASTYASPRESYVIPCASIPSCVSSARSNTPRYEETLPAPLCNAVNLVPSGPFGFAAQDQLLWDIVFPLPRLRSGWERWESIRFTASKITCRSRFQAFQCLLGGEVNPFTTGNPFLGTKLLGFSIGRGSGALKGLRHPLTSTCI